MPYSLSYFNFTVLAPITINNSLSAFTFLSKKSSFYLDSNKTSKIVLSNWSLPSIKYPLCKASSERLCKSLPNVDKVLESR